MADQSFANTIVPALGAHFLPYNGIRMQFSAMMVVPCFNEESRLDSTAFLNFLDQRLGLSFVFVNDGSDDGTVEVLKKMKEANPSQITVLNLKKNYGKAEAVRRGMKMASSQNVGFVGYWDADLATPLCAIDDMLSIFQRNQDTEVVMGARRAMLGHKVQRKLLRRLVSRICARLARVAIKLPVNDTQCGAKIFQNSAALSKSLESPFTSGWLFDVELLARLAHYLDYDIEKFFELPLLEWREVEGSKVLLSDIFSSGLTMMRLIAFKRLTI